MILNFGSLGFYKVNTIVFEFLPLALGLIAITLGYMELFAKCILFLCAVYVFGSWYLFKAHKHNVLNIIIASLSGFFLSVTIIGLLFQYMRWESDTEMILTRNLIILYGSFITLVIMVVKLILSKIRWHEFTVSMKIFSQYVLIMLVINGLELNEILIVLLERGTG